LRACPDFKTADAMVPGQHADFASHVDRPNVAKRDRGGCFRWLNRKQLGAHLGYMADKEEFFSPHGIRALSHFNRGAPVHPRGQRQRIQGGL